MDETEAAELLPADEADKKYLTARQAVAVDKAIQLRRQNRAPIEDSAELKAGPARCNATWRRT
jgi:hypothetical protein